MGGWGATVVQLIKVRDSMWAVSCTAPPRPCRGRGRFSARHAGVCASLQRTIRATARCSPTLPRPVNTCMSCSSHLSASRSAAFAAPGAASGSRRSPSSTISATSHSLSVLRVLARFLLPSAPSSSIPAVSNSFAGPKSCSSIRATLTSAVVPGVASTMLVSCRVIALIAVDFPAFMTPNTPMLMRCTSEPRSVDGCRGCTAAGADAGADGGAELQNARMALLPPSSPPQRRVWTRDVVWSRGRPAEPWSGRAPVAGLLREVRATGHAKV
mmetsp:Transcript_30721/g.91056  ORF Transcript_30721/g.91056 Transcript_30721/m.91056 type:complete len:270 (+) Transcript_30721:1983-2792(+)